VRTRYKLSLFRGVSTIVMKAMSGDRDALLAEAELELIKAGAVEAGDTIVFTVGEPIGVAGGTNTLKIVKVGAPRQPSSTDHPA